MCGRFVLVAPPQALIEQFELESVPRVSIPPLPPRFNVAPGQDVAVVRASSAAPSRELAIVRWGLIPFWAPDPKIGSRMINARAEGVEAKPAFRAPFKSRRCLVIADGFFEWKRAGKLKEPYYFRLKSGRLMAFAGLWDRWAPPEGAPIESCAILTTGANKVCLPIHDRMPVILGESDYDLWLDPAVKEAQRLTPLLGPSPAKEMTCHRVSPRVNSPVNDDASLIQPVPEASEQLDMPL